jgi:tetratricopeptide (TPR) repeat protein
MPESLSVVEPQGPAAWRQELARVLASRCFEGAKRNQDLLSFLVSETLAGRGDRLKEYVIGVEILGRPVDFDPRMDTNVRTEAWRLRERLRRYYATEGASNPFRIELPRRSFVPVLQQRPVAPSPDPAKHTLPDRTGPVAAPPCDAAVVLALHPFRVAVEGAGGLSEALADELALELGDHPGLRIAWNMGERDAAAHWALRGSLRSVPGAVRTLVQLVRLDDCEQLWSRGFEHAQQELAVEVALAADLPRRLARDIAHAMVTGPLAAPGHLNRPVGALRLRASFVRTLLCSGFERMAVDVEAMRRQVRRLEAWLLHHPGDLAAHRELAVLLAGCICAAPASRYDLGHLVSRCSRELLAQPSGSVEALVALGLASMSSRDWHGAKALLDAALRADPTCSDGHVVRGLCALHMGEVAVSAAHLEEACAVDAGSALAFATLGFHHFCQLRFSQAATAARHALSLDPHCEPAAVVLADSELSGGHWDEGIAVLQQVRSWSSRWPAILGRLGHAYALMGRQQSAHDVIGELQRGGAAGVPVHVAIADVQIGLGDADAALMQLSQSARQCSLPDMLLLRSAPRFDHLRRDARFCELIEHTAVPALA